MSEQGAGFFSKFAVLVRIFRKDPTKAARFLLRNFEPNPAFLYLAQAKHIRSCFIISRNDQRFVEAFIKETAPVFARHHIEITGGFGSDFSIGGTMLFTDDKIAMIPANATLVSDMFELQKLRVYSGFVCVDDTNVSLFKIYLCLVKKIL